MQIDLSDSFFNVYLEFRESEKYNETYKWIAYQHWQESWNWSAEDKVTMLSSCFVSGIGENLWQSSHYYPTKMLVLFLEFNRARTIAIINDLFDESKSLDVRMSDFKKYGNSLLSFYNEKIGRDLKSHYFGDRFGSLLLSLQYPEKYAYYKHGVYKEFSKSMNLPGPKKGASSNYRQYMDVINAIKVELLKNEHLLNTYMSFTSQEEYYNDNNLLLLSQDLMYTNELIHRENENNTNKSQDIRYWIYAPGKQAYRWEDFYNSGIAAINYDKVGDLSSKSKEDIAQIIKEDSETSGMNHIMACYEFAHIMKKGDIIFVKKGKSSLIGYGEVIGDYFFDSERKDFKSIRAVKWISKKSYNIDWTLALKTLTNVTSYLTDHPSYEKYSDRLMAVVTGKYIPMQNANINKNIKLHQPLNQILYGPPGTGKTYSTINLALNILGYNDIESREEVIKKYGDEQQNGKIVFTTFHQSMSYEDFVEGIKPSLDEDTADLGYEIKDGILKSIAKLAIQEYVKNNEDDFLSFDERYNQLLDNISESEDGLELKSRTGSSIFLKEVSDRGNITVEHVNGTRSYIVSKSRLDKVFHAIDPKSEYSNINKAIRNVIGGSNASAYWAVNEHLHKLSNTKSNYEVNTDLSDVQYQKILHSVNWKEAEALDVDRYVIIIDEINRGNVSGIFGELITLLEQDKRIDRKNKLVVKLPYSKIDFALPSNLYIIGTMNTADRSVEALDTALRRRFSFEEIMPNTDVIKDQSHEEGSYDIKGIDLVELLDTINNRINLLIDRDHQIGHSYLLGISNIEELKEVFKNKIIPLLQEYFYNDYSKIQLVIGKGFVSHNEINSSINHFAVPASELELDLPDYSFHLIPLDDQFDMHLAINLLLDPSYSSTSESI